MKFKCVSCLAGTVLLILSCSTFLVQEQIDDIMTLQHRSGVMKSPVALNEHRLEKGQRVKLHVIAQDDSIRIYAYPAEVDFLKSHRLLVLYLFEDDFKDGRYSRNQLLEKLDEFISLD